MDRMRGRSLSVVLVAAAALMASPVASAKPGYFVWPGQRSSQLTVKGTEDFKITITRTLRHVELSASNGSTAAIYIVRSARDSMDVIEATFPGLGRVSLRFHPQGKARRETSFCKGRASIRQMGLFRGAILFQGERGFTRVATARARGFVYRSFKEVCEGPVGHGRSVPGYSLTAGTRSHGRLVAFNAFRSTKELLTDGETHHFANVQERRNGMRISRVAVTEAPPSTFVVEGLVVPPRSATVTPPSPFSGTASFRASPSGPIEWQGTLAVDLPGGGIVPLVGPSFGSELCLNRRCVGRRSGT
jgi:hypothetical protein